jgi:hypothetical protein
LYLQWFTCCGCLPSFDVLGEKCAKAACSCLEEWLGLTNASHHSGDRDTTGVTGTPQGQADPGAASDCKLAAAAAAARLYLALCLLLCRVVCCLEVKCDALLCISVYVDVGAVYPGIS